MSKEFPSFDSDKISFTKNDAHGWIQWKGTDVCIDIHCACGELSHYVGCFMYHIKCPYCGKVYQANGNIQLIEIDFEPSNCKEAFK